VAVVKGGQAGEPDQRSGGGEEKEKEEEERGREERRMGEEEAGRRAGGTEGDVMMLGNEGKGRVRQGEIIRQTGGA